MNSIIFSYDSLASLYPSLYNLVSLSTSFSIWLTLTGDLGLITSASPLSSNSFTKSKLLL